MPMRRMKEFFESVREIQGIQGVSFGEPSLRHWIPKKLVHVRSN